MRSPRTKEKPSGTCEKPEGMNDVTNSAESIPPIDGKVKRVNFATGIHNEEPKRLVTLFTHYLATSGSTKLAKGICEQFIAGEWRSKITEIRKMFRAVIDKTGDYAEAKKEIKTLKLKLPAICFTGEFSGRSVLNTHAGLFCADIDDIPLEKVDSVKATLSHSPYVWFSCISPSGAGVKAIIRVRASEDAHKANCIAVQKHLSDLFGTTVKIDPRSYELNRLCFVTWDETAYSNWEAKELPVFFEEKDQIINNSSIPLCPIPTIPYALCSMHTTNIMDDRWLHLNNGIDKEENEAKVKSTLQKAYVSTGNITVELFERLVLNRYVAGNGERNSFIVEAAPFLYRAISKRVAVDFIAAFYDCNATMFKDSRKQHVDEASAAIDNVAKTYRELMDSRMVAYCDKFESDHLRDAYRIIGDLAQYNDPEDKDKEPLTFYLGEAQLAARLGVSPKTGGAILFKLRRKEIIRRIKVGTAWEPGKTSLASVYRWLHPPTPISKQ